jgi:hypothetical protein
MARTPTEPTDETLFAVIPYEYASEIAYVISGWAQLEYDMDALIWELAGLSDNPDVGACLTAQFSTVNVRINALLALARVQGIPSSQIAKLNKFRERASAVGERRNRVAHDPWLSAYGKDLKDLQKVYRLQRTARAKLEHEYKPVSLEELQALRSEIEEALQKFNDLASDILRIFWKLPG